MRILSAIGTPNRRLGQVTFQSNRLVVIVRSPKGDAAIQSNRA